MTLKARTRIYLAGFVVVHFIIFAFLSEIINTSGIPEIDELKQPLTVFGTSAFLITFVLQSVLPASAKHSIVFWRVANPLPGSRAFSELMHADSRIDVDALGSKYGELPAEAADQNRLWYRMYKSVEDKQSVLSSHHDFLLARDLTALSLLFAIFLPIPFLLVGGDPTLFGGYFFALIVLYGLFRLVGVRTGERFVTTVLAEDSVSA